MASLRRGVQYKIALTLLGIASITLFLKNTVFQL